MIDFDRSVWLTVAAASFVTATGLYLLGVIPWWGILVIVPAVTIAVVGGLMVALTLAWIASGSH